MMSHTTYIRLLGISCLTLVLACGIALLVAGTIGLEYVIKTVSIAICISGFAAGLLVLIGMAFQPKVKVYQEDPERKSKLMPGSVIG